MAKSDKQVDLRSAKWRGRRDSIIDTSAAVFAKHGYNATSTIELCEANGIGKGTLYYYIGSKEQLLVAIHDRVMDEVMQGADRAARLGGSPPSHLALLGEELLDVVARYPDHVWVFLHEFPALTGKYADAFRRRRREYERRVESVFETGTASGHFRPLDPSIATKAWLGMHNYSYLWLRAGGRYSIKEVAAVYADIFVWGVSMGAGPAVNQVAARGANRPERASSAGNRRRR